MSSEYNKKAILQEGFVKWIVDNRISAALSHVPDDTIHSQAPFVIADFGCAGGHNSLPLFEAIVEHVRAANPKKQVLICMEDVPENDFSITFETVNKHF